MDARGGTPPHDNLITPISGGRGGEKGRFEKRDLAMELGCVVVGVADLEDEECGFGGAKRLCVAQHDVIREGDAFGEDTEAGDVSGATDVVVAEGAAVDAADTEWLAGIGA